MRGQVLEELGVELKKKKDGHGQTEETQHAAVKSRTTITELYTSLVCVLLKVPSGWSCFLGMCKLTPGGIDIEGIWKPAGSVSMEPAIMPSPAPPSRARNLLRHEGERRKDLSSPLYREKEETKLKKKPFPQLNCINQSSSWSGHLLEPAVSPQGQQVVKLSLQDLPCLKENTVL